MKQTNHCAKGKLPFKTEPYVSADGQYGNNRCDDAGFFQLVANLRSDQFNSAVLIIVAQNLLNLVNDGHLLFFVKFFGLSTNHNFRSGFADGLQVDFVDVNRIDLVAHFFQIYFIFAFQLN